MATETAYKFAFLQYLKNNQPKTMSLLSFKKGFHGRTLGALSTTTSKALNKVGFPAFQWAHAPFPSAKFPYADFEMENTELEKKCLDEVDALFKQYKEERPIAAVMVEPIMGEGGDNMASPEFYIGVQEIAKSHGALLIVDEVQTGGACTGKFWAHEYWGPRGDPDIVTFAKKLQVSGLFMRSQLRKDNSSIFSTLYQGDPLRLLNLKNILDVIESDKLMDRAQRTGAMVINGLRSLSKKYPIFNPRGAGLYCAFDAKDGSHAGKIEKTLLKYGVLAGTCGDKSIRFRASLVFDVAHAEVYLERLGFALDELYR